MNDSAHRSPEPAPDTLGTATLAPCTPSWAEARARQRQRLSRIRRSVQRGEYENDLKIAVAAERLLERLLSEK